MHSHTLTKQYNQCRQYVNNIRTFTFHDELMSKLVLFILHIVKSNNVCRQNQY